MHPEKPGIVTVPHPKKDIPLDTLDTPHAVTAALGGSSEVARLCEVKLNTVSTWKKRGKIPPEMFLVLQLALDAKYRPCIERLPAPAALWGIRMPPGITPRRSAVSLGAPEKGREGD